MEVIRQTNLLHDQLVEHFEFEEETAVPKLEEQFPTFIPQLRTFLGQHDPILESLEELRSGLKFELSQLKQVSVLSQASSETQLFDELAKQIAGHIDT